MSNINWGCTQREPTRKEIKSYNKWKKYLSDSRLSQEAIESRARSFAEQGRNP
jgi:hypothetical protein